MDVSIEALPVGRRGWTHPTDIPAMTSYSLPQTILPKSSSDSVITEDRYLTDRPQSIFIYSLSNNLKLYIFPKTTARKRTVKDTSPYYYIKQGHYCSDVSKEINVVFL